MAPKAVVDTTGGLPGVQPLQIDSAELKKLASLYQPGQTLWRIPIRHFTPWDWNYSYGPPDSATFPDDTPPKEDSAVGDSCTQSGSVIECQNQTLGEAFAIAGTPYALHYQSDRQPGRASWIDIPIEGQNPDLKGVLVNVNLAGQAQSTKFLDPPGAYHVAWDNRDGFGNLVQGAQPYQVEVGYAYKCVYRLGYFGGSGGPETWVDGDRGSCQNTLWRRWKGAIGHWLAIHDGLGGMSLDVHHAYDPVGRVLYLGDGRTRRGDAIAATISTVAGNGSSVCTGGMSPSKLAVAPDGALYIADEYCGTVRRMPPGGSLETTVSGVVAGKQLLNVGDLALAPDGLSISPTRRTIAS